MLCQSSEESTDEPVCFISRKLMSTEVNYPTIERELLEVVYSLFKLCRYLLDKKFVVYTDNMTVKYLFAKKNKKKRAEY